MPSVITPIIDTAIGIVVVYIAFSLLTSWLGEKISSYTKVRSRMLVGAIVQLLSAKPGSCAAASARGTTSSSVSDPAAEAFFSHPIFQSLRESASKDPQYLSAQQFSSILLGVVQTPPAAEAPPAAVEPVAVAPAAAVPAPAAAAPVAPAAAAAPVTTSAAAAPAIPPAAGSETVTTATTGSAATPTTTTTATTTAAPPFDFSAIIAKAAAYGLGDQFTTLAAKANGNYGAFVQAIEDWYDDHMDRVSGWFVKYSQKVLVLIGLVLAIMWNVDSVRLARAFSCNAALRTSASSLADQTKNKTDPAIIKTVIDSVPLGWDMSIKTATPPERALSCDTMAGVEVQTKAAADKTNADKNLATAVEAKKQADADLKKTPDDANAKTRAASAQADVDAATAVANTAAQNKRAADKAESSPVAVSMNNWGDWAIWALLKILGLALTAVALSQGANFWFDALSKLTRVRDAGKKPDTSPDASRA